MSRGLKLGARQCVLNYKRNSKSALIFHLYTYNIGFKESIRGFKMLEGLFGSVNQEKILIYLLVREKGFGAEMARFYETDLSPIQKQLDKLELAGILVHEKVGRTLLYKFNPRYLFLPELKKLLNKAFTCLPPEHQEKYTNDRKRPRRKGKPL